MTTTARIAANRANSQHSTGPKTEQGRINSGRNNFRHGLAGGFQILNWESEEEFRELYDNLRGEHTPSTPTEILLVECLAQHFWLMQRAIRLQDRCFHSDFQSPEDEKRFALYLRYQTTHERAFHHCLNELLKLRAEKRKQEIGFESQTRRKADDARKQANENRKQELHRFKILVAQAKLKNKPAQISTPTDSELQAKQPPPTSEIFEAQHLLQTENAA